MESGRVAGQWPCELKDHQFERIADRKRTESSCPLDAGGPLSF